MASIWSVTLVEPGDAPALHAAMLRLLEEEALCDRFGSAGYARARQRFTRTRVTDQIEAIFQSAV
jgi:glycosyltransferase involved in cell wall biosynthesis